MKKSSDTTSSLPLSIVIPIYNEEKTLPELIRRMFLSCGNIAECIFVDDGSTDSSLEIIQRLARPQDTIITKKNEGKGSAVRRGYAISNGDYTIVQDADLEYSPEEIPSLLSYARQNAFDAVFGSRRRKKQKQYAYFLFFMGGKALTLLCNILYGTKITDQTTCYKMVRTSILRQLHFKENDFRFDVELTCHLALRKIHIGELPISYSPRTIAEQKKIGWQDWFKGVWVMIKMRIFNNT